VAKKKKKKANTAAKYPRKKKLYYKSGKRPKKQPQHKGYAPGRSSSFGSYKTSPAAALKKFMDKPNPGKFRSVSHTGWIRADRVKFVKRRGKPTQVLVWRRKSQRKR